jgi:hypothetical protein
LVQPDAAAVLEKSTPVATATRHRQSLTVVVNVGIENDVPVPVSVDPAATSHGLPEVMQPRTTIIWPTMWSPASAMVGAVSPACSRRQIVHSFVPVPPPDTCEVSADQPAGGVTVSVVSVSTKVMAMSSATAV